MGLMAMSFLTWTGPPFTLKLAVDTASVLPAPRFESRLMPPNAYTLETSHAAIHVAESGGDGPAALLIHGNSASNGFFRHQLESEIGAQYRLIAIDLPGHGRSSNAHNLRRSYSMPGYADMATEVMDRLGIGHFAVLGWSLGGHVAIEMISRNVELAGLMITGTPPVSNTQESFAAAFKPSELIVLTGKPGFTEEEAEAFVSAGVGGPVEPFMRDAGMRADGRARAMMVQAAVAGWGADQRHIVETSEVPVAVVSGREEPFVNNDYLRSIAYANLWEGRVHIVDGAGHAPFWQAPDRFNPILARFLGDVVAA
jgi:pimeloyl-ACP methyl ester carboxylesterase